MFRLLLLLFLIIPILEIYLLIQVGGWIGALPTVFLVVLTAVLGAFFLRQQGFATLERVQQTLANGRLPATELLEGAFLLVGGALLLTPGFFTDAIGFACLVPILHRSLIAWAIQRGVVKAAGMGAEHQGPAQGHRTYDGEYWKDDDNNSLR